MKFIGIERLQELSNQKIIAFKVSTRAKNLSIGWQNKLLQAKKLIILTYKVVEHKVFSSKNLYVRPYLNSTIL